MVVLEIEVDGVKKPMYMDNKLYREISTKIHQKIHKKDFDWVWVVDGTEGSGKSTIAMQVAKILDPNFDLSRVCMTPEEFTKAILKAKKGQCVVYDEAFTGLSSRASLTEINRLLVSLMMEMRQKNLFVIIVMPTFFLLDRYVALFRARGLFHVYLKNGKRGQWVYFNNKKKKLLYLKGKKLFSYGEPRSLFRGRFMDQYTVNEAEYRKKKKDALEQKSRTTKAATFKAHRDSLVYMIYKKYNMTQKEMAKLFKEYGWDVARNRLSEIITERETFMKKKKIEEEIEEDES